ncbi:MAG: hypothetical protein E5Y12_01675 [Mesorhizobium sp.]|nr:MAG: hypothetical protein E5Y12_01675 [Mesorhizobium sp.]
MSHEQNVQIASWQDAIAESLRACGSSDDIGVIQRCLYERKAPRLADAIKTELKSLLLSATICDKLHQVIMLKSARGLIGDHEHTLIFPFATDAILSAYNARRILGGPEMKQIVGENLTKELVVAFDTELPRAIEASDAIRHHHDRAFGRFVDSSISTQGQMIAHWGATLTLTDRNLEKFNFEFHPRKVEEMLLKASLILVG